MPNDEVEWLTKALDDVERKLITATPGNETGKVVYKLANAVLSSRLDNLSTEINTKIEALGIAIQPKAISIDWAALFASPFDVQYTVTTLRLVLGVLWTVGGPRSISAFFKMRPPSQSAIKSLRDSINALDPDELGDKFHLSVVIENMSPSSPANYEPSASIILESQKIDPEAVIDASLAAILVVYATRNSSALNCTKPDLKVLQDSMRSVLESPLPIPYMDQVLSALSKSPFCFEILEPFVSEPSLMRAVAQSKSTAIPESWCSNLSNIHYFESINVLMQADLLEPSPIWAEYLVSMVGQHPAAYSALIDYMLASKPPNGREKSLRMVAAVAMLTQSVETPTGQSDGTGQAQTLQVQLLQENPRLINFGQGHDEAILANSSLPAFSQDIEVEMKLCFQRMYEQQHDIQEVIAMLEKLKRSDVPRDQDLFACMIHSLFDEYRFFPQYPVKALATTAVLFGSLVHFHLIEGISLAIALKLIMDALRQDVSSNIFRFGLQALIELRQRLPELPKFCKALMAVQALQKQHQLYDQIKAIADPDAGDEVIDLFRSINPTMDEDDGAKDPAPEEACKKVALIVNNLTAKTLAAKAQDLLKELDNMGMMCFAKLIIARAINEPNYHALYADLLDLLPLNVSICCVDVTISKVATLVHSLDATSTEKRTSLKNLGQMLGFLTLARGRPLLFHKVNLKLLLADGVKYDKLSAVLPFVAKFLALSAGSKLFGITSPWIAGILAVLSELYSFGSLKLSLKFEIEVLGSALGVEIPKLEPAFYIRDELRQQEDAAAIAATFGTSNIANTLAQFAPPSQPASTGGTEFSPTNASTGITLPPVLPRQSVSSQQTGAVSNVVPASTGLATAPGMATIGTGTSGVLLVGTTDFVSHPGLRQLLDLARSKTLQDVLLPVIERSVSIASFTAKELVLKDLAREQDEGMLQAAAHAQAIVLASSMAIVTAKDPFIETLSLNLRTMMIAQGYGNAQLLLDQIGLAARETIDSLVPLIKSVTREKVILEVNEALHPAYSSRQQARAMGTVFEPEAYEEPSVELPELLSVRKDGLLPEQMTIYDQFALHSYSPVDTDGSYSPNGQGLKPELQQLSQDLNKLEGLCCGGKKKLGDLDQNDEILVLLSELIAKTRNHGANNEEIPLCASHLVVHTLFEAECHLFREVLCFILGELCRMSGITAKEVVLWLLYADDPKKYNAKVIGTLLRSRLVTPTEIDATMTKDLAEASKKPVVVDFAARLLLDALIGPEPYCLRSDFAGSILAMSKLSPEEHPAAGVLVKALNKTRGSGTGNEGHVFAEWTRLMQHHATANSPTLLHAFIRDLHTLGWGSNPQQLVHFIQIAVSVSVKSFSKSKSFVGVDAIAILITTLLKTVRENKELARTLFAVITLLIARDHESENFEALPYFRLLSSIACSLPTSYVDVFAETVLSLQPLAFPGFVSGWITLMSHRFVMGRLLEKREQWPLLFELLIALIMFLRKVWVSPISDAASRWFVYRGTERICLVILHDEPEFFIRYANETTALLVSEFVQLRNLILCAFPEGEVLPHPAAFESTHYQEVPEGVVAAIEDSRQLLKDRNTIKLIENACMPRPQLTPQIVLAIQTSLAYAKPFEDHGVDFNSISVSMRGYNALVTYIGYLHTIHPAASGKVEDSSSAQLCGRMLLTLPRENKYAFVSALANHLRFPEKHTFFYSRLILALFTPFGERMFKDKTADVRHIVTRVLLERLMAHRPHPWGLMVTFSELLKNPSYNFWEMPFIKASTDISSLFSTLYTHVSQVELQA